jgi:hypothetical protein
MQNKNPNGSNPLELFGYTSEESLPEGGFGAVLARAGVGKTALLVQLALYHLLAARNVLHISLNDPVDKVNLWYREVFQNLRSQTGENQMSLSWETILPHRFIMTFRVEGFSVPKLEERLTDLMAQKIFKPRIIIIDGLPFEDAARETLLEFKTLARKHAMTVWFTARTHRHDAPGPDGIPSPLAQVFDLFDIVLRLHPEDDKIHVRELKGTPLRQNDLPILLDPGTMLITKKD